MRLVLVVLAVLAEMVKFACAVDVVLHYHAELINHLFEEATRSCLEVFFHAVYSALLHFESLHLFDALDRVAAL